MGFGGLGSDPFWVGPNFAVGPNLDPKNGSKKVNLGFSCSFSQGFKGSIWVNLGLGTVGAFGTKVEI